MLRQSVERFRMNFIKQFHQH